MVNYGDISLLLELEKRLREKKELEFGDPTAVEYARLYEQIQNSLPSTIEELIEYTRQVECQEEKKFKSKIESTEADLADAKKRLKAIAKLIQSYLPEEDNSQKPL
ncbi:hypothetical protein KY342_00825 [Candidatus Woesearchaeota archaeon]|nr:hypothetical protein [Candidatus Woesearchaeota archaeon]